MAHSPTRSSSRIISKFSTQDPNPFESLRAGVSSHNQALWVVWRGGMLLDRGVSLAGELLLSG